MTTNDSNGSAETSLVNSDDEERNVQVVSASAIGAIAKSEAESQIDCAHKYPRSIKRFLQEAVSLATMSQEISESCIYTLPRAGKSLTGPSIRLAEICASAYGNLHCGARVIDITDKDVVCQGVAWDLEKNLRVTTETRRRITKRDGRRFDDDMITVTGNAGASIALRNAIFRVVPRSYVNAVYDKARQVAVGDAKTLVAKRDEVMKRLGVMGATPERVFAALAVKGVEDITLEHLETLIGFGTAIKNGDKQVDECFPAVAQPVPGEGAQEGKRISLGKKKPGEKSDAAALADADDAKAGEPGAAE